MLQALPDREIIKIICYENTLAVVRCVFLFYTTKAELWYNFE